MIKSQRRGKNLEEDLIKICRNLSCVISEFPADIVHSGIELYDPFGIEEEVTGKGRESAFKSVNRIVLHKEKSSLDNLLNDSRRKTLVRSEKYASEAHLQSAFFKKLSHTPTKRKRTSHQAWNNKQLIKVYGMRYNRSIRNLNSSYTKSPKKNYLLKD